MCHNESTLRSRLPDLLPPQFDWMTSSCEDRSGSLRGLGTLFVATVLDAKDLIDQLETLFCDELWPAFCGELEICRCRITELEECVNVSLKEREERQRLKSQREDETTRLRAENNALRMELGQLSKTATTAETERQIMQSKLQSLLDQNLDVEKQRQRLADEIVQLQLAAKLSTTKELFLQAENQKLATMRSELRKSEYRNRLSLKRDKKVANDVSHTSWMAGKDPVSSEGPHNVQENSPVRPVCILQGRPTYQEDDQNIDHCVASASSKEDLIKQRSFLERKVGKPPCGVTILHLESVSAEATCEGQPAKNSEALQSQTLIAPQRPRAKSEDAMSLPCPPATVVDSDETVMDIVQEDPTSAGTSQDYPLVSISSETEAEPCDAPVQLPSGRVIDAVRCVALKQKTEEETGTVRKVLVSISSNLPNLRPPGTKVENKPAKGPKERSWRQTRHRIKPSDLDPHDSFLDTPRERVLAQLENARTAQFTTVLQGSRRPVPSKLETENTEAGEKEENGDERPEPSSASSPLVNEASNAGGRKEIKAPTSKTPPFKFNEPVRKKRDRESLQATDCKICKKFYDAVAVGDASGMMASKCEHQNAVSRHRFKYLPPPTPEGFWNIGFDDSADAPDHPG